MKKKRLRRVRERVAQLEERNPVRDKNPISTPPNKLYDGPTPAPIEVLDMRVFHARTADRTAGCIAGITLETYPKAAARAIAKLRETDILPPISRVAEQVLGLTRLEGFHLFQMDDVAPRTPDEAARACDRLMAGKSVSELWD